MDIQDAVKMAARLAYSEDATHVVGLGSNNWEVAHIEDEGQLSGMAARFPVNSDGIDREWVAQAMAESEDTVRRAAFKFPALLDFTGEGDYLIADNNSISATSNIEDAYSDLLKIVLCDLETAERNQVDEDIKAESFLAQYYNIPEQDVVVEDHGIHAGHWLDASELLAFWSWLIQQQSNQAISC